VKKNRTAQQELYTKFYPVVFRICLRYASNTADAKDLLQESFIRVFTKIKQYKGKGSFEGWLKRVVVTTSINIYKTNKKFKEFIDLENKTTLEIKSPSEPFDNERNACVPEKTKLTLEDISIELVRKANFNYNELIEVLKLVPEPYRIVFNLFIIEEYSHEEISKLLNINIKTSWTRLHRAKQLFQKELSKKTIDKLNA